MCLAGSTLGVLPGVKWESSGHPLAICLHVLAPILDDREEREEYFFQSKLRQGQSQRVHSHVLCLSHSRSVDCTAEYTSGSAAASAHNEQSSDAIGSAGYTNGILPSDTEFKPQHEKIRSVSFLNPGDNHRRHAGRRRRLLWRPQHGDRCTAADAKDVEHAEQPACQ